MKPEWLAQLAPPHAPPPASWWPLAPGWWGLAILIVAIIAGALVWRRRRPVRLRRAALRELKQLEASAADDDAALARGLQQLVRRFAVARFGRAAVAGLSGERWIGFVVAHGGTDWAGDTGAGLLQAAYGGVSRSERARWISGARAFLKTRK